MFDEKGRQIECYQCGKYLETLSGSRYCEKCLAIKQMVKMKNVQNLILNVVGFHWMTAERIKYHLLMKHDINLDLEDIKKQCQELWEQDKLNRLFVESENDGNAYKKDDGRGM